MYSHEDYLYLTRAYREGYVRISHQEARVSLEKIGYITPAKVRERYGGQPVPFCYTLTKKGQKRAKEIVDQQEENYLANRTQNIRGYRGAAFPRSYRIDKRQ